MNEAKFAPMTTFTPYDGAPSPSPALRTIVDALRERDHEALAEFSSQENDPIDNLAKAKRELDAAKAELLGADRFYLQAKEVKAQAAAALQEAQDMFDAAATALVALAPGMAHR